jgi:hypothetical protein
MSHPSGGFFYFRQFSQNLFSKAVFQQAVLTTIFQEAIFHQDKELRP